MKDFWKEPEKKKINKKKIIISILIIILIAIITTLTITYINNKTAREWIDKNIFQKEKTQNNLHSIEIEDENNSNIYAFNKYIGILNKNNFKIYDNTGKQEKELTIEITKPIFNYNNRYLVVQLFDSQGNSLFKTILSTTRVVATSISDDNKYLAIAQVDTSGTMVQSNIRIMSIDDSKKNSENAIKKVYSGENNELITNIKYQEKNKLLCMYTDKIELIKADETVEKIQEFKDKKISFASIELSNASVTIEEKSSGLFTADSVVNIINSENKSTSLYTAEAVTKEIYTNENIIALNLGSEVEFINTDQEITSIVVSNSIAGIIYRDKIEIINL